jgi:hypothetical protein
VNLAECEIDEFAVEIPSVCSVSEAALDIFSGDGVEMNIL